MSSSMPSVAAAVLIILAACGQLESEQAQEVADATRQTVARGVDKAKQTLDRVDMDKVRHTWDAAVGSVQAPSAEPSQPDPLADVAEAIACDQTGERCTVTAEFLARAREHSTRVAHQVRVSSVEGEVRGIRIEAIDEGSVAQQVGLRVGDVITHVNQAPLGSMQDAMMLYMRIRAARSFTVDYRRGEQERVLVVDVVQAPEAQPESRQ